MGWRIIQSIMRNALNFLGYYNMAIAIRKNKNIKKALTEIFAELNFQPGKIVYVKPNLCGREPVLPGENTSIEVMDALLEVLLANGSEVIIGHGELLGSVDHKTTFAETLKSSGFDKYQNRKGVKLLNLDDLPRTEIKTQGMTFHLPLDFLNNKVDTYINLAKIKMHMETAVSFSMKNQMGLASPVDRIMMHKVELEEKIAELGIHAKPTLNILEGFPAMEHNGPHHGKPRQIDLVVAGADMVELDSFVAMLLGIDFEDIKHLAIAESLSVGRRFDKNELSKYKDFVIPDFRRADKVFNFGRQMRAYPTYSCSRCINVVNLAGREFKKHPFKYWRVIFKALFSREKINIIFGRADELDLNQNGKFVCVGNCAKNFSERYGVDCLDKCPPGIEEAREYIVKKVIE